MKTSSLEFTEHKREVDFIVSELVKKNVRTFSKQICWAFHYVLKKKIHLNNPLQQKNAKTNSLFLYLETEYEDALC